MPPEGRACEKPEVCLDIILTAFGEKRSLAALLVRLLQLEQRAGESIRDYSIRVSDAGERLRLRQEVLKEVTDNSNIIRDHFIDGLRDGVLRKVLRDRVFQEKCSFLVIRDMALRWVEDTYEATSEPVVQTVAAVNSNNNRLDRLESLMDKLLQAKMQASQHPPLYNQFPPRRSHDDQGNGNHQQ